MSQVTHRASTYRCFLQHEEDWGISTSPSSEWDASLFGGFLPTVNVGTHLYAGVERGAVRVKRLAQEHTAMSLTRARVECTNHDATMPP